MQMFFLLMLLPSIAISHKFTFTAVFYIGLILKMTFFDGVSRNKVEITENDAS